MCSVICTPKNTCLHRTTKKFIVIVLCIKTLSSLSTMDMKYDPMVCCPFNPQHVMHQSSLQNHVVRCMENYPNYVTCPYNALHRFKNNTLLRKHMMICPSKETTLFFEPQEQAVKRDTCFHIDETRKFNLQFEDWDRD